MKSDERVFLIEFYEARNFQPYDSEGAITARELINTPGFPLHYKRAWYLLEKWSDKGWYDYGVTLDLGWLTPEGKEYVEQMIIEQTTKEG